MLATGARRPLLGRPAAVVGVLVLPFAQQGATDPSLGIGLAHELAGRLAATGRLVALEAGALAPGAGRLGDLAGLGRRRGYSHVLGGSVVWPAEPGDQLLVETLLVRVADGAVVWRRGLTLEPGERLSAQADLTAALVREVVATLGAPQPVAALPAEILPDA